MSSSSSKFSQNFWRLREAGLSPERCCCSSSARTGVKSQHLAVKGGASPTCLHNFRWALLQDTDRGKMLLLPRPLWCRVRVGVDRRRCGMRVDRYGRVGVGWVRWGRILRHNVMLVVANCMGWWRGSGWGGREVEVEWGRWSGGGGGGRGRCRSWDPLEHDVGVQLRFRAVESRHWGLQQTLLTPIWEKKNRIN